MQTKTFVGTCVDLPGQAITNMMDRAREVTLATFRRHTDRSQRREIESSLGYAIGQDRGLHLKDDYQVSFWRSRFQGKPCVYMEHSCIEWVFVQ